MPRKKKDPEPRCCKHCGKSFTPEHGNRKFCKDTCTKAFYRLYRTGWKKEHTEVESSYVRAGARAYNNIKQRCTNPNHPSFMNYGGRGIQLLLTREEFIEIYMSVNNCEICGCRLNDIDRNTPEGRTLDRIDQARSYEKGNLRILCRACNASLAFSRRKNR